MTPTMTEAMAEMHEAKAERDRINAELDKLKAEYASLGQQASTATHAPDITAAERLQKKNMAAQSPLQRAWDKNNARIEAAKAGVAKAAEEA